MTVFASLAFALARPWQRAFRKPAALGAAAGPALLLRPTPGWQQTGATWLVSQETTMSTHQQDRRTGDRQPWRRPEFFNPDNEGWVRPVGRARQPDGRVKQAVGAARDFGKRLRQILSDERPQ